MERFSPKTQGRLSLLGVPIRLYLGGVFLVACLFKIHDPYTFALSVATYQILPLELVNPLALVLPWVELIVGLSYLLGFWTKQSALLILGMMLMFLTALLIALNKDLQLSCGCFASQDAADEIGLHTVFRDLGWMALALYTLLLDDGRFGLDGLLQPKRDRPR